MVLCPRHCLSLSFLLLGKDTAAPFRSQVSSGSVASEATEIMTAKQHVARASDFLYNTEDSVIAKTHYLPV